MPATDAFRHEFRWAFYVKPGNWSQVNGFRGITESRLTLTNLLVHVYQICAYAG